MDEVDEILSRIINQGDKPRLDDEDMAFIQSIADGAAAGNIGVFLVLQPDEQMKYLLLNCNRAGAISLLAHLIDMIAGSISEDL